MQLYATYFSYQLHIPAISYVLPLLLALLLLLVLNDDVAIVIAKRFVTDIIATAITTDIVTDVTTDVCQHLISISITFVGSIPTLGAKSQHRVLALSG